jgi:hypothetical protein
MSAFERAAADRAAGGALVLAALGIVVAMSHHPSGAHSGALGGIVHGAMIGLLMLMSWGFLHFAIGRGASRPLILGGLLAYGVSLFAHIGAATINGFVVPALADPTAPPVSHDIFLLAWQSNQALAKLGATMTGLAYVLWSIDLIAERRRELTLVGLLGLAAGSVPAALLAFGLIRMDVAGAGTVYAIHVAWAMLVGIMLLLGRFVERHGADAQASG